jgi:tetratricopeptide (TPR) repeat protein
MANTAYPELTLVFGAPAGGGYRLELRFWQPGSESEVDLTAGQELSVVFDHPALEPLLEQPNDYGRKLAEMLFATQAVRKACDEALAAATALDLPLRVRLQAAPEAQDVQRLAWETLYDTAGKKPLFAGERVLFSRYVSSADPKPVKLRPKRALRALVVAANPSDLDVYGLPPVEAEAEFERAKAALKGIEVHTLGGAGGERASLAAIFKRLRQERFDILYIVAHGMARKDESYLWLENEQGETGRVSGAELIAEFQKLDEAPLLAALLACESAAATAGAALTALGPRLAAAGAPAVLAMQGKITMETGGKFMAAFFDDLSREGVLDHAAAAGREAVSSNPDWWMPALFTRIRSATIFGEMPVEAKVTREVTRLNRNLLLGLGALAAVLILLGMGGYYLLRPEPPPKAMSGAFNVAVARFQDVDQDGKAIKSADGEAIAAYIAERLQNELQALGVSDAQVWGPELTRAVSGEDIAARTAAASQRAEAINAQVLVYGVIRHAGGNSTFQPEFIVTSTGFRSNAPEITGQNQLGKPLGIRLPFEKVGIAAENPAFVARSQALNLITQGLTYYARDDFLTASQYFRQALALDTWLEDAGREVAHLLLGNALSRQASRKLDLSLIPEAMQEYKEAQRIQEENYGTVYGRALTGEASITYMQAFTDMENISAETIDPNKLNEAEAIFTAVLALKDQPESSQLPAKAAVGLGQVYQARAILEGGDWLEQAEAEYQSVVDAYQASVEAEKAQRAAEKSKDESPVLGNLALRELASFAYARLALIEVDRLNYEQAVELYDQSIAIATPYWEARYATDLSFVYAQNAIDTATAGDLTKAAELFDQAIRQVERGRDLAANLPDQDLIKLANERLKLIRGLKTEVVNG